MPEGRWAQVPAYGWSRFDACPPGENLDADVLLGEGLHGRLDPAGWHAVLFTSQRQAIDDVAALLG